MAESPDLSNRNRSTLVPFDENDPTAADAFTHDLNAYYDAANITWIMTATVLVLLMIPGVGFFYSGLTRRKSALSLLWVTIMAIGITSFQWFFWGYSLAFSPTAGKFLGNLDNFGFKGMHGTPSVGSDGIPDLLFGVYQGMFSAITVALAAGATAERGRLGPSIVFMFVWATLIYDPIASWTWNPAGWILNMGGLDFAGGTPVHIASGAAALAYSFVIGKRTGYGTHEVRFRPHNVPHIVLGTVFIWVGYLGFNGGSALSANIRSVMAVVVTNISGSIGGVTWCVMDYRLERKWSTVGFCMGVISGLVAITPGSGFVPPWAAVIFGVVGAVCCNMGTKIKYLLRIDEPMDVFAIHGVGGFVGMILTGFFAADYIPILDGETTIPGGWVNHNYIQMGYQLAAALSGLVYSFGGTCLILYIMDFIPGLSLRASPDTERLGMDDVEVGEFAYDYVEVARDVVNRIDADLNFGSNSEQFDQPDQFDPNHSAKDANDDVTEKSTDS